MHGSWKTALRTRLVRATIGVILIGGVAGVVAARSIQGGSGSPVVASRSSTATSTPTTPSAASTTVQVVVTSGVIASVDPSSNTLVLTLGAGNQQVIQINSATQFVGAANALGQLRTGMQAQVTGQMQTGGSLAALALVTRFRDN